MLWNRGHVQPLEALDVLSDLTATTGARIVLTSRTSFWNTGMLDAERDQFVQRTRTAVYRILPFDLQYARSYFLNRLPKAAANQAVTAYSTILQGSAEDFVGRGFMLTWSLT